MLKNFAEIEQAILADGVKKKVALAGAHDHDALSSVVNARKQGVLDAVLVGRTEEINALLAEMGENTADYQLIAEEDEANMAATVCRLVVEGKADIPMKGIIQTSTFMRALLNKEYGFIPAKALVSQATVFEFDGQLRLLTDCAVNIAPIYEEKEQIVKNAVALARTLGYDVPRVACLAPVETVNPAIQATIDAAMLSKAADRGQIKNCVIDGPLGLDNAISAKAAEHKGIKSPVAGRPDILLVPDLNAGNMLTKALTYFAGIKTAGAIVGPTVPVIMTSRTDSPQDKYHSILTAIYQVL